MGSCGYKGGDCWDVEALGWLAQPVGDLEGRESLSSSLGVLWVVGIAVIVSSGGYGQDGTYLTAVVIVANMRKQVF